jgi:hypothetical protein
VIAATASSHGSCRQVLLACVASIAGVGCAQREQGPGVQSTAQPTTGAPGATAVDGAVAQPLSAEAELAHRFVGVWQPLGRSLGLSSDPVLTPAAQADVDSQTRRLRRGDMTADLGALCIPRTMPSMTSFGAQEILSDAKKITWIMESSNAIRWIWLDGRDHPPAEEVRPTAMGHSIASRDGDTLVVDSIGFMPRSRM